MTIPFDPRRVNKSIQKIIRSSLLGCVDDAQRHSALLENVHTQGIDIETVSLMRQSNDQLLEKLNDLLNMEVRVPKRLSTNTESSRSTSRSPMRNPHLQSLSNRGSPVTFSKYRSGASKPATPIIIPTVVKTKLSKLYSVIDWLRKVFYNLKECIIK